MKEKVQRREDIRCARLPVSFLTGLDVTMHSEFRVSDSNI